MRLNYARGLAKSTEHTVHITHTPHAKRYSHLLSGRRLHHFCQFLNIDERKKVNQDFAHCVPYYHTIHICEVKYSSLSYIFYFLIQPPHLTSLILRSRSSTLRYSSLTRNKTKLRNLATLNTSVAFSKTQASALLSFESSCLHPP